MDEQSTEKQANLSFLQLVISLIAIFAPLLYLIGLSFYSGYTSAFGISSGIFEMSVQDVYYFGYLAIFTTLFDFAEFLKAYFLSPKGVIFTIAFFSLLLVISLSVKYIRIKPARILSSITRSDVGQVISVNSIFTAVLLLIVFFFSTAFALWGLPSILGYHAGKTTADNAINLYLEKGCHSQQGERWSNCTIIQSDDGEILFEGILIASSDSHIAFFTQTGAIVAQFPKGATIINALNNKPRNGE